MSIWEFANPTRFVRLVDKCLAPTAVLSAMLLAVGLVWGLFLTPDDYVQGSAVKIIFVHVPSALMAINIWIMMLVASMVWLVRRHRVSVLAAKSAAPVGAVMALAALLSGGIWGQPMWGTWWAWDPRLTSFLLLFLCYLGYMALWHEIEDKERAADLTSILCMVGSVFAFLSRYAVNFWQQGLHQGASLSLDRESNVHNAYYIPLLVCMAGFAFLFIALVLLRTRTEIREQHAAVLAARLNSDVS
ncbi:MAG: heme ABC transporter permease [Albidovulum sp.]|nr:heme ABC transporter permease [Albidovulum sp.]MDE0306974.1 heme ABC transporter permease [Albidovulum sp.]MDE0530846.1 heme ABC transporter permease [Albidovulum sp.]